MAFVPARPGTAQIRFGFAGLIASGLGGLDVAAILRPLVLDRLMVSAVGRRTGFGLELGRDY